MTREQHEKTRLLDRAEAEWLESYGWRKENGHWHHQSAPFQSERGWSQVEAMAYTKAEPLRFGANLRFAGARR